MKNLFKITACAAVLTGLLVIGAQAFPRTVLFENFTNTG